MSDSPKAPYVWSRPTIAWDALVRKVKAYRKENEEDWEGIYVAEAGCGSLDDLPHFSHPSVVIAPKQSFVGGNILGSLFANNAGHTKLLVVHNPGQATGITTVMDNEVTLKKGAQIPLLFGAFQKGAALAVDYCILAGILPQDPVQRADLVIGIEAYLDATATDPERVQDNAMVAIVDAIVIAVTGGISPEDSVKACASQHVFSNVTTPAGPDVAALAAITV